jgi:hypothetical protein
MQSGAGDAVKLPDPAFRNVTVISSLDDLLRDAKITCFDHHRHIGAADGNGHQHAEDRSIPMADEAVSPLQRRMIEDMTIRKLAPKTRSGVVVT